MHIPFEQAMGLGPGERGQGEIQQRGMGAYTLCGPCNNRTGKWYGAAFADWCHQGMDILARADNRPTLIYPHRIFKQLVAMFLSINREALRERTVLTGFVLGKEKRHLPPRYRFFVYYNIEGRPRMTPLAGTVDFTTGQKRLFSEITFPPFGYILSIDSPPPDYRQQEITHFARYDYNERRDMPMRLPVLPTHVGVMGDYRDKDQILREARESGEI